MRDIMTKLSTSAPRLPRNHFYPKYSVPVTMLRIAALAVCLWLLVRR